MDLFSNGSTSIRPKSRGEFKIDFTNVSPLLQIEVNDAKKGTATMTKRMYQMVKGIDYPIAVPVFSSNAMRGVLRRIALEQIAQIGKENGYDPKISARSINLYASGDSGTVDAINKLSYFEVEKLRALSPLLSCFGAGLSGVEGKTAVTELRPDINAVIKIDDDKISINTLVREMVSVRFDQTKRKDTIYSLIDVEDIKKWVENVTENSADFKEKKALQDALKKAKEGKVRLSENEESRLQELENIKSIQSQIISSKEYVVPNVLFHGSIATKRGFEFSKIEEGMIVLALYELAQRQLGSCKKDGFGVGDWTISHDELGDMEIKTNHEYILGKKEVKISEKMIESINLYKEWVKENKAWDYLEVDELLKKIAE